MRIKKLFCKALLLVFCLVQQQAFASDLTVGSRVNIYPYYFFASDSATYDGIVPLVLRNMLSNQFLLKFSNSYTDTTDIILQFENDSLPDKYDWVALPIQIDFVVCYHKSHVIRSMDELRKRKTIVATTSGVFPTMKRMNKVSPIEVSTDEQALKMLLDSVQQCALLPVSYVRHLKRTYKQFSSIEFVPTPFISQRIGLAVRHRCVVPAEYINDRFIANMNRDKQKREWIETIIPSVSSERQLRVARIWIVALVVIILLLIYIIHLVGIELGVSTKEHINELVKTNITPIVLPLGNPMVAKLLDYSSLWFVINDKNGKVVRASSSLLSQAIGVSELPANTTLSDIFPPDLVTRLTHYDNLIYTQQQQAVVESIRLKLQRYDTDRWIIKYPFQFSGRNEILILSMIVPPVQANMFYNNMSVEVFLKAVLDSLPDIVYIKDTQGRYLQANKAFYNLYNLTEQDMLGHTDFDLFRSRVADSFQKSDNYVIENGTTWVETEWESDAQGNRHKFENKKVPLFDYDNKVYAIMGISHEITHHELYDQELREEKEEIQQANLQKQEFLMSIGSDFREPSASTIELADLLYDNDLTFDQRADIVDSIKAHGNLMLDMVNGVADFSQIDNNAMHIKNEWFNINSIMATVFNNANNKKIQLGKENVVMSLAYGAYDDEVLVNSDSFRLQQVLKNTIDIGLRYTKTDRMTIGYQLGDDRIYFYIDSMNKKRTLDDIRQYVLNSQDTNINPNEDSIPSTISTIIAQRLVKKLNGRIWIDLHNFSEPFILFYIPYSAQKNDKKQDERRIDATQYKWNKYKVLIAEDEDMQYTVLQGLLAPTGISIYRAADGVDAINMYDDIPNISIVLMDIKMPRVDGFEAARQILLRNPNALIIAQTNVASPEYIKQFNDIGFKSMLMKPISQLELYHVMDKYLGKTVIPVDEKLIE